MANKLVKTNENKFAALREELEKSGRQIYQENKHFRKLANVMEHPEFREFIDEYLKDADTLEMLIRVYEAIEKHSSVSLTPYQKIAVLKGVLDDPESRRMLCNNFLEFSKVSKETKKLTSS